MIPISRPTSIWNLLTARGGVLSPRILLIPSTGGLVPKLQTEEGAQAFWTSDKGQAIDLVILGPELSDLGLSMQSLCCSHWPNVPMKQSQKIPKWISYTEEGRQLLQTYCPTIFDGARLPPLIAGDISPDHPYRMRPVFCADLFFGSVLVTARRLGESGSPLRCVLDVTPSGIHSESQPPLSVESGSKPNDDNHMMKSASTAVHQPLETPKPTPVIASESPEVHIADPLSIYQPGIVYYRPEFEELYCRVPLRTEVDQSTGSRNFISAHDLAQCVEFLLLGRSLCRDASDHSWMLVLSVEPSGAVEGMIGYALEEVLRRLQGELPDNQPPTTSNAEKRAFEMMKKFMLLRNERIGENPAAGIPRLSVYAVTQVIERVEPIIGQLEIDESATSILRLDRECSSGTLGTLD